MQASERYEKLLGRARLWTGDLEIEPDALEQIRQVSQLPILAGPLAVMPDVHLGKGATVGTVIPTRAAIVPAAVGVDIGCGMLAVKTDLAAADLPQSLERVRSRIERDVPVGFAFHRDPLEPQGGEGARLEARMRALERRYRKLRILARMGRFDSDEDLDFSTVNGTVSVEFTGDLDADIELSTVNGRFRTDYPVTINGRLDPRHLRARLGKGGRRIRLSTVNGNVELRRRG